MLKSMKQTNNQPQNFKTRVDILFCFNSAYQMLNKKEKHLCVSSFQRWLAGDVQ